MLKSIRGVIDTNGKLQLSEKIQLKKSRRVIVTILDEEDELADLTLLSEAVLAREWDTPEEDKAWEHLDQLPSL